MSTLYLVEPADQQLQQMLAADGEGVRVLRGRPLKGLAACQSAPEARGWQLRVTLAGVLATRTEIPFALWVQGSDAG